MVLADDHLDVLEETRSLLAPDFLVVSWAADANSLLQAVRDSKPEVVVTDIRMPGRSGIDAGREIVRQGLCKSVVVLSLYNDPQLIQSALDSGIRGYVLKEDAGEELASALRAVLAGGCYLSRGAAAALPL